VHHSGTGSKGEDRGRWERLRGGSEAGERGKENERGMVRRPEVPLCHMPSPPGVEEE